eukprot:7611373-Heterocapsa_arctica.AAC.1
MAIPGVICGRSVPVWLNLRRRYGARSGEEDHRVPYQLPAHHEGARQEVSRISDTSSSSAVEQRLLR